NGASGGPDWLRELREGAIGRFAELGFPTMKQEEWRFTSVAPIADQRFIFAHAPGSPGPSGTPVGLPAPSDIERLCLGAGPRVVFVDGRHAPTLSTPADLVGGVRAGSLAAALPTDPGRQPAPPHLAPREGPHSFQVATTHSRQERDSYLGLHVVTLGAALARHDIDAVLDGAGAELILNGLYLLGGAQHADHHTVIDHAQPHCASHEFFNGVLAERAHGVFNGRIVVRPGAQRTDSKQTNNNLLLSTEARADSQPQLEIYADDVKCTHGSTVGPIDQMQLYYLRSRGLSPEAARSILTYGFGAETLGRMRHPDVRDRLDRLVRARLA